MSRNMRRRGWLAGFVMVVLGVVLTVQAGVRQDIPIGGIVFGAGGAAISCSFIVWLTMWVLERWYK